MLLTYIFQFTSVSNNIATYYICLRWYTCMKPQDYRLDLHINIYIAHYDIRFTHIDIFGKDGLNYQMSHPNKWMLWYIILTYIVSDSSPDKVARWLTILGVRVNSTFTLVTIGINRKLHNEWQGFSHLFMV